MNITIKFAAALSFALTSFGIQAEESADGKVRLEISRTELAQALNLWAQQTGYQLIAPVALTAGLDAPAVSGYLTAFEALDKLLQGTSLSYEIVDKRKVVIRDRVQAATGSSTWREAGLREKPANLMMQEVPTSEADTQQEQYASVQEIVVTAQKREQRAFDVPISIVAISGEELRRRNLNNIDDLGLATPGLSVQSQGGYNRRIMLRGISNVFGNSSLIGLYLDEASVTTSAARQIDLRTYDLERVEVLRGPQGTLYGEGSVGGTIRFITRNPDLQAYSLGIDGSLGFTEDGSSTQRIESTLNIPLVENVLGLRVAGLVEQGGGWVDQPAAGREDINDQDLVNVRVKGLWRPTERLAVNAMALVHRNDTAPNMGEDADGNFNQVFNLTTTPYVRDRYDLFNLTVTYDFSAFRLLSATSYLTQEKYAGNTAQRGQYLAPPAQRFDAYWVYNTADGDVFTEELRLSSIGEGPWTWTAGAFFRRSELDVTTALAVGFPLLPGSPVPNANPSLINSLSKSWAVFGETSYALNERLTLGAGLRYFEDKQEEARGSLALGIPQEGTFDAVNPRVYAQYKLADSVNLYSSVAKGFRSGGFNSSPRPAYDPETVWTYEVGTKLLAAEGRLSADVALYYSDYSEYQISGLRLVNGTAQTVTSNAGNVMIRGIEGSLTWRLLPQWSLSVGGNYMDSKFYEVNTLPNPDGSPSSSHAVGDPVDLFPEYSYSVQTQRDFNLGGKEAYARLDYSEQGRSTYRSRSTGPWFFSESSVINLLNANFGLQWNENLSLTLYGQNLLDDRGYTDAFSAEELASRSRPRTFGIGVGVTFR